MCKRQIKVIKNGPFELSGITHFRTAGGHIKRLKANEEGIVVMCRCGQSFEKPYCDGSHIIFEFDDEKAPHRQADKVDVFVGEDITIYENKGVCSHRGICYEDLKAVFVMTGPDHIIPNGGCVEDIIDICKRCPSGALSFSLPGGQRILKGEASPGEVRMAPRRYGFDGPIEVLGGVGFVDDAGNTPESPDHYSLCRCGASYNKPFCSGQHWQAKFIDESNDEEKER